MYIRIDKVERSKSGRSLLVRVGKETYLAGVDSKIDSQEGNTIDADCENRKIGDKVWPCIITWARVDGAAVKPEEIAKAIVKREANHPSDRFYMPFVSNVVAHAILANRIQDYPAISQWAKAARDAAVALDMLDEREPGED